ncbi:hypothetical protein H0E87_030873 [Populus deltoides]|uniref:Uncharacterized protein n=1 Tax=Populus deltoides TaxID=3696 RepID=A0A8T2WIV5_POPDE|nr:hypothetical protein H0E87_030873 [Populus deltoides]
MKAFYHPGNYYLIHVDADAPGKEHKDIAEFVSSDPVFGSVGNVWKPNLVTYRGPTMLATTLHAMSILSRSFKCNWIFNLIAFDYPLITQDGMWFFMLRREESLFFTHFLLNYIKDRGVVRNKKLFDLGDGNPIPPPLSTEDHGRPSPLELPLCITSKQMSLPSSFKTSSSSWVPTTNLYEMTTSRALPPASLSTTPSVGCDDKGFTLVTRKKRNKDIPKTTTRATPTFTSHVASFYYR